jgi:hypothetical protein
MIIKIKKKKTNKNKKKIMKKGNKTQNYIVNSSLDSLHIRFLWAINK